MYNIDQLKKKLGSGLERDREALILVTQWLLTKGENNGV